MLNELKVSRTQALEGLHKICSSLLDWGQAKSDYSETELAEGICLELWVNDLKVTIERSPEITAEIETAKALEKASQ
jgi:hypothetical protein